MQCELVAGAFTLFHTKCQKTGLLETFQGPFDLFYINSRRGLLIPVRLWTLTAQNSYMSEYSSKTLMSVPNVIFGLKNHNFCKIYQKTNEELHEKYFKILPAALILLVQ
jgi:hypothetical protein